MTQSCLQLFLQSDESNNGVKIHNWVKRDTNESQKTHTWWRPSLPGLESNIFVEIGDSSKRVTKDSHMLAAILAPVLKATSWSKSAIHQKESQKSHKRLSQNDNNACNVWKVKLRDSVQRGTKGSQTTRSWRQTHNRTHHHIKWHKRLAIDSMNRQTGKPEYHPGQSNKKMTFTK